MKDRHAAICIGDLNANLWLAVVGLMAMRRDFATLSSSGFADHGAMLAASSSRELAAPIRPGQGAWITQVGILAR